MCSVPQSRSLKSGSLDPSAPKTRVFKPRPQCMVSGDSPDRIHALLGRDPEGPLSLLLDPQDQSRPRGSHQEPAGTCSRTSGLQTVRESLRPSLPGSQRW